MFVELLFIFGTMNADCRWRPPKGEPKYGNIHVLFLSCHNSPETRRASTSFAANKDISIGKRCRRRSFSIDRSRSFGRKLLLTSRSTFVVHSIGWERINAFFQSATNANSIHLFSIQMLYLQRAALQPPITKSPIDRFNAVIFNWNLSGYKLIPLTGHKLGRCDPLDYHRFN